jgi:S1-C subfamily serine protease
MPGLQNEKSLRICLAFLVVGLAGLLSVRVYDLLSHSWRDHLARSPKVVAPAGTLPADEQQTIQLFENAVPSIVYVRTIANTSNDWNNEPRTGQVGGASGFVWESNFIVTCYHVVRDVVADETGNRRLLVQLRDGTFGGASVVGFDEDTEVAVLKVDIEPKFLKPIPLASSKEVRVGQRAYAIGNPLGREYTLTGGLVSALDREIETLNRLKIQGVVQTDAAVNPGNSGGPLLDSSGRLIGMVVATATNSQNIGFAIPADTLNLVVPELIRYRKILKPGLGVQFFNDLNNEVYRRRHGIDHGLFVSGVAPGSLAEEVGLRRDDVIVAVDGVNIDDRESYLRLLDKRKIGDSVSLKIVQNGEERSLGVTLQERRPF